MKFLKNNFKAIIAFIVGMILAGGIVYAATSASQINYTKDKNAEIKDVASALNDLYNMKKENIKSGSLYVPSNTTQSVDTGLSNIKAAGAWNESNDRAFCFYDGVKHKTSTYDYEVYAENGTLFIHSGASGNYTFYWFACEEN